MHRERHEQRLQELARKPGASPNTPLMRTVTLSSGPGPRKACAAAPAPGSTAAARRAKGLRWPWRQARSRLPPQQARIPCWKWRASVAWPSLSLRMTLEAALGGEDAGSRGVRERDRMVAAVQRPECRPVNPGPVNSPTIPGCTPGQAPLGARRRIARHSAARPEQVRESGWTPLGALWPRW